MDVDAFAQSHVGKVRGHNEDSYCSDPALGLFVVCDGMGGHAAGEEASATATREIHRYVAGRRALLDDYDGGSEQTQRLAEMVNEAVIHASQSVFDIAASDRGKHGMGTTCVMLLIARGKAFMANVGDSRLYMLRDGQLYQLSTDHNFLNESIALGMMTPEQAATSPHAHVLTRAVGTQPSVCVDLLVFDVLAGDTFLLCSDGLYEYTRDPMVMTEVLNGKDARSIPERLVERSLEGGGHDNITALVVRTREGELFDRERRTSVIRGLDALHDIELFRDLTMAELVKLYNLLESARVDKGTRIIVEGDDSDKLYIIVEGEVSVAREGQEVAVLGAGAHFGEMALLNHKPRSATVTATAPTTLLQLSRDDFSTLIAHEAELAVKFLWKFAQSLSLRLDDAYLARDLRIGRRTVGMGPYPEPGLNSEGRRSRRPRG